eukprot:TRINITY_DN8304_c0_g1_i2.p1 TRINITY_DN8304_c0_g1~~TRINITY_DN8304_c0_g1_i2.p1  ORF type:complete len:277 (+),score=28.98 TRINITY_DN8304_c0_g1_i2:104-934(+)
MTTASHALMTAGTGGDAHEENRGLLFEKFLLKLPGRVKSIEFPVLSLCTCLAVLTAISSVIVQLNSDILYAFRSYLQEQTDNVFFGFLLWAAHTLTLVFIAIFITDKFAPAAAGSGVPQMKTIISGSGNPQWLSKKTLLVKFVGLCCTSASGMFCGGVGPFIHIGAMFAETLMKHVPWFQQLRRHPGIYPQLLVVGCSVGITSSLGVPIGGMLICLPPSSPPPASLLTFPSPGWSFCALYLTVRLILDLLRRCAVCHAPMRRLCCLAFPRVATDIL